MFATTTYIQRRETLINELSDGIILLLGNEESPMNYTDNTYRFRQDSNFLYYIGLDRPHLAAIVDIDNGKTTLFGNDIELEHIIWTGSMPSLSDLGAKVGIQEIDRFDHLPDILAKAKTQGRTIHFLPPYRAENKIRLHQWLSIPLDEVSNQVSIPLIKAIVQQASLKSAEEIVEIEKALEISKAMHVAAMKAARPGIKEAELVGIVEGVAIAAEGQLAYPIILTVNGQTLHNHYHGNTLQSGQLVLGDFGAENKHYYASDITRTFPVDPTFTSQQKEIYEIVLQALNTAIAAIEPGVLYRDIHLGAAKTIAKGLKDLGLMKGDLDEAIAQGAHALFFPHGLGHHLGLDVHDMEDLGEDYVGYTEEIQRNPQFGLRSLRLGKALEKDFVLTVEPGIYFIPQLIENWKSEGKFAEFINYDALSNYYTFGGVRIEDDVLVTEHGSRILGSPIPKSIAEVEAVRQGG